MQLKNYCYMYHDTVQQNFMNDNKNNVSLHILVTKSNIYSSTVKEWILFYVKFSNKLF